LAVAPLPFHDIDIYHVRGGTQGSLCSSAESPIALACGIEIEIVYNHTG
jgi:hypothetical protein